MLEKCRICDFVYTYSIQSQKLYIFNNLSTPGDHRKHWPDAENKNNIEKLQYLAKLF